MNFTTIVLVLCLQDTFYGFYYFTVLIVLNLTVVVVSLTFWVLISGLACYGILQRHERNSNNNNNSNGSNSDAKSVPNINVVKDVILVIIAMIISAILLLSRYYRPFGEAVFFNL